MNLGKLIYDSAMNNVPMEYANCSVKEREDAIREKLFEVLGVEGYEVNSFSIFINFDSIVSHWYS